MTSSNILSPDFDDKVSVSNTVGSSSLVLTSEDDDNNDDGELEALRLMALKTIGKRSTSKVFPSDKSDTVPVPCVQTGHSQRRVIDNVVSSTSSVPFFDPTRPPPPITGRVEVHHAPKPYTADLPIMRNVSPSQDFIQRCQLGSGHSDFGREDYYLSDKCRRGFSPSRSPIRYHTNSRSPRPVSPVRRRSRSRSPVRYRPRSRSPGRYRSRSPLFYRESRQLPTGRHGCQNSREYAYESRSPSRDELCRGRLRSRSPAKSRSHSPSRRRRLNMKVGSDTTHHGPDIKTQQIERFPNEKSQLSHSSVVNRSDVDMSSRGHYVDVSDYMSTSDDGSDVDDTQSDSRTTLAVNTKPTRPPKSDDEDDVLDLNCDDDTFSAVGHAKEPESIKRGGKRKTKRIVRRVWQPFEDISSDAKSKDVVTSAKKNDSDAKSERRHGQMYTGELRVNKNTPIVDDEDPVLAARRKKFESTTVVDTSVKRVVRLKTDSAEDVDQSLDVARKIKGQSVESIVQRSKQPNGDLRQQLAMIRSEKRRKDTRSCPPMEVDDRSKAQNALHSDRLVQNSTTRPDPKESDVSTSRRAREYDSSDTNKRIKGDEEKVGRHSNDQSSDKLKARRHINDEESSDELLLASSELSSDKELSKDLDNLATLTKLLKRKMKKNKLKKHLKSRTPDKKHSKKSRSKLLETAMEELKQKSKPSHKSHGDKSDKAKRAKHKKDKIKDAPTTTKSSTTKDKVELTKSQFAEWLDGKLDSEEEELVSFFSQKK